jgi:uncharacterized protein
MTRIAATSIVAPARHGDWLIFRPVSRRPRHTPDGRKMCLSPLVALALLLLPGCVGPSLSRTPPSPSSTKNPLAQFEDSLIFHPTRFPDGDWNPRGSNWERGRLAVEDAWFQSADGTKLHGWYYPHENPRAVVLFCHGNAGNLSYGANLIRCLHDDHRLSVFIFDYRGFGRSAGTPDEQGVLADARAARAWLARRAGVAEQDIVLMGQSLGGAVAVDMAANNGARGLILRSTFTSLPDVAGRKLPFAGSMMQSRLNSLAKIGNYHGPLLQSHGTADTVIPYENGLRLFEAANEPKQFVTLRGAEHNDPAPPNYFQALDRFIDTLPPPRPAPPAAGPNV